MIIRRVLSLALAVWPGLVFAQDWATRELCFAPVGALEASHVAPLSLEALEAAAADAENGIGRYWRVTAPGGAVSHLWGTYHTSMAEVLDLPDFVTDEIATARAVAVEIDFTYPDRGAIFAEYEVEGRYRMSDDPFAVQDELDLSFLGSDVEGWVLDRLIAYGTFEDALYVLTYAGLAELLLGDPCEDYVDTVLPVQDDLIQTLGHIAGAEIIGLEATDAFFVDLADKPEVAQAIVAVYASYLQPPRDADSYSASVAMYQEGRLGLLAALDGAHLEAVYGAKGRDYLQKTDAYLLTFRNERFLERALPELTKGDLFMAVGALHLPGEAGLVSMLRARGFEVTRVPVPGEVE